MNENSVLITCASWEDRFVRGFANDINELGPTTVILYYLDAYATWSYGNRKEAEAICERKGISFYEHVLTASASNNWRTLHDSLVGRVRKENLSVVELTTAPREVIWQVFWFLEYIGGPVKYVYYRPESYSSEWLSRDPQKPRLMFKMGGISLLDRKTCLVVIPGYDIQRMQQLRVFFEPAVTFIGLQAGAGDLRNAGRMATIRERFAGEQEVEIFELNAYSEDHGQRSIEEQVAKVKTSHNIIMSSLGPKLSAVALYRIQRSNPEVGLTYAPSREFNKDYSRGIGKRYEGLL